MFSEGHHFNPVPTESSFSFMAGNGTDCKSTNIKEKTAERRNERERKRIGHLKKHFGNLQTKLPKDWQNSKMSKLDILSKSIRYIRHLQNLLSGKDCSNQEVDLWALCSPLLETEEQQNGGYQSTRTVTYQHSSKAPMTTAMTSSSHPSGHILPDYTRSDCDKQTMGTAISTNLPSNMVPFQSTLVSPSDEPCSGGHAMLPANKYDAINHWNGTQQMELNETMAVNANSKIYDAQNPADGNWME
ncbi:hypothetical protein SNE40_020604 [Patella caerulea]|uniref:BHLH domain-containing protein n=1 Tax=Patella caerulea TaxID=87958 RepID=A0AAN8J5E6_PATCE